MKLILIVIFSLLIYSCRQTNAGEELKMKSNEVRERLVSTKPLPSRIMNTDYKTGFEPDSLFHNFVFHTIRTENNVVDSVRMILSIIDDSLLHLYFFEEHYTNGKAGKEFYYFVNKYGNIDYAETNEPTPDSLKPTSIDLGGGGFIADGRYIPPKDVIDFNSRDSSKSNPSKKIVEMYNARLKLSVDELYCILFKQ